MISLCSEKEKKGGLELGLSRNHARWQRRLAGGFWLLGPAAHGPAGGKQQHLGGDPQVQV